MKKTTTKPINTPEKNKPVTDPGPTQPITPSTSSPILSELNLKRIFIFSLIAMLIITLYSGYNVGFNSDELEMNNYGKANLKYYLTAGKDTTLSDPYYKLLNYYGNGYEMIAATTNKILGTDIGPNEFNVRHIINQVLAIVGLLFTGLIARKFTKSWAGAIFSVWLLYLTPSFMGHFLFNTRDIPFYAGYVATLYFIIQFLEELPAPRWSTTISLMLAFAFTTNIRIGGFLLLFYFGVFGAIYIFTNKDLLAASLKNVGSIAIKLATAIGGGIVLIILTWPFMLKRPAGLIDALGVASKFPLKVNINFEGVAIDSLHLPLHYIPKYMMVTIPVFIIACIIIGLVMFVFNIRNYSWKIGALLLLSIFFPVIYAIGTKAALYSSWRHFLFVFPGLCIFGGLALQLLFSYAKKLPVKLALGAVCILSLIGPISFSVRNNPFEYCYFNELAGGFKTAYLAYDNDYWEISVKDGLDWVMQHENLGETKDSVTIATNASAFVTYYVSRHYPKAKIKVAQSGYTMRNSNFWTYAVFNSVFLKPDYLENYFPPPHVYSKNIEDIPVTIVMKDTVRLDWKAAVALKSAKHAVADSLFNEYIKTTKDDNVGLYAYMAVAKGSLNKNDDAIRYGKKCLEYHLSPLLDYNSYCGLGIAYANKGEWQLSISNLNKAMQVMPKEVAAKDIMTQVVNAKRMSGH